MKEKKLTKFAKDLKSMGFIDRVDASPSVSLYEYGILRNPNTGETVFAKTIDKGEDVDNMEIARENISKDAVKDALEYVGDGFYNFIGSSKEKELERIKERPEHLASIIHSLNMYSGTFSPRIYRSFLENFVKRKKKKLNEDVI